MSGEHTVEVEVLRGLRSFVEAELAGGEVVGGDDEAVVVRWRRPLEELLGLRTAVAAYLVRSHPVPRPKGLLGHQHLTNLVGDVALVGSMHALGAVSSFRFSAAGSWSPVFQRLATELATATGLVHDAEDGDLLIRVRPGGGGWETLVRLSPRPLSARAWRVQDLPGALNATIAAAMVGLASPARGERVLNLMCGSGTLLAEAADRGATLVGVDLEPVTAENLAAARARASVIQGDVCALPVADRSVDVLLCDPPYGERMGRHDTNESLYADLLTEAARVARPHARFVFITHELKRFERVLRQQSAWSEVRSFQVFQKGHNPKVWLLRPAPADRQEARAADGYGAR